MVLWIIISAGNSNSTVLGSQNLMILWCPAHECCRFCREGTWFSYFIGRSLVLNITKCLTLRVHSLWLLFASAVRPACALQGQSWASSNEACNGSKNVEPSRLHILSWFHWPTMKTHGRGGVYLRSSSNGLRSVDECIDVLYAYSASESLVSHWSWWRVVKACRYDVTCLFENSDSPSVRGWNTIDISSLVCNCLLLPRHLA